MSEDLFLLEDPRESDWRRCAKTALPEVIPRVDTLEADASGISELLNLAWGMHEIIDTNLTAMTEFMSSMESEFGR